MDGCIQSLTRFHLCLISPQAVTNFDIGDYTSEIEKFEKDGGGKGGAGAVELAGLQVSAKKKLAAKQTNTRIHTYIYINIYTHFFVSFITSRAGSVRVDLPSAPRTRKRIHSVVTATAPRTRQRGRGMLHWRSWVA